jgi:AAHS family 4-hydroxybenzoate transporter-like MFS transporter
VLSRTLEAPVQSSQDIEAVLDAVKPNAFLVSVWALCAMVLFLDGYDLTVIAFMAPELVKEFGFTNASLGFVFSAGLVGMALGGPLGGWVGDRYGRRLPIVSSCLVFGCATLAMLLASSVAQLAACRFVTGVGLGVALGTAVAITADFAPRRMRSRVLALVSTCVPFGTILPGVLTATLVPSHGWRLLVIVGGGLPVLLAIVLLWRMPESLKYQAMRPELRARLAAVLERLGSELRWIPGAPGSGEERARSVSPARLFGDGLAPITLSIWLLFFVNAMALYLVISWLPLVLQSLGMSIQEAGQTTAMFSMAGLVGGLVVATLIARVGVALLPAMFMLAIPLLLMFATMDLSRAAIVVCVLIPGISFGALQVGCFTVTGMLYPTSVRVTGAGWAVSVGRIGAIFGPIVGSAVFSLQLPPQQMIGFATVPMVVGAIGGIVLAVLCYRRFGSLHVDDRAGTGQASPAAPLAPAIASAIPPLPEISKFEGRT